MCYIEKEKKNDFATKNKCVTPRCKMPMEAEKKGRLVSI